MCTKEKGFTCTTGSATAPSVCTEACGDGLDMGINECDDGNTVSGDGCSSVCNIEVGWSCGEGSMAKFDLCYEICGDGRHMGEWLCDDGN